MVNVLCWNILHASFTKDHLPERSSNGTGNNDNNNYYDNSSYFNLISIHRTT